MRRFASLILLLLLGVPASSWAQTCEFLDCPPVNTQSGQKEQAIFYYHLDTASPVLTERHEYFNGSVLLPPAPQQAYERLIHEIRVPVLRATCQKGHKAFEQSLGVEIGDPIDGELKELVDPNDPNQVVGTVFIDDPSNGVEAKGGVLGTQKYYECTTQTGTQALLQNVSVFNPGFDVKAIDGATLAKIRQFWINPIQADINAAAHDHVVDDAKRSCVEIPFEDYSELLKTPGVTCAIEYDFGDPTAIIIAIPPR